MEKEKSFEELLEKVEELRQEGFTNFNSWNIVKSEENLSLQTARRLLEAVTDKP